MKKLMKKLVPFFIAICIMGVNYLSFGTNNNAFCVDCYAAECDENEENELKSQENYNEYYLKWEYN